MRLYHFTHPGHLPAIFDAAMLTTTESNIGAPFATEGPTGLHAGPDVVWLLDSPTIEVLPGPTDADMTHGLYPEKRAVRFEVDVPGIRWLDWAPASAMSSDWRDVLIRSAGGMEAVEHWYIFPAPIRQRRWVEVRNMVTDSPMWTPST